MPENLGIENGEKIWQVSKEKEELMVGFSDFREKKVRWAMQWGYSFLVCNITLYMKYTEWCIKEVSFVGRNSG